MKLTISILFLWNSTLNFLTPSFSCLSNSLHQDSFVSGEYFYCLRQVLRCNDSIGADLTQRDREVYILCFDDYFLSNILMKRAFRSQRVLVEDSISKNPGQLKFSQEIFIFRIDLSVHHWNERVMPQKYWNSSRVELMPFNRPSVALVSRQFWQVYLHDNCRD